MENKLPNQVPTAIVPQLRLRTDLHSGGGSVEDCQKAMNDWQSSYYKWYDQVNATKSTPCNKL